MPRQIVDRFNVDGVDYEIEPVLDDVPTEDSPRGITSGGVYRELIATRGDTPVEFGVNAAGAFTRKGAFDFFLGCLTAKDWSAKVLKNFGYVWKAVAGDYPAGTGAYSSPVWNGQLWVQGSISKGVYWSEDGKHWVSGTGISSSYTVDWIMYGNGRWVACSGNYGMYYSDDGKDWSPITTLPTQLRYRGYGFSRGRFYAYAEVSSSTHIMYTSTDGLNWEEVNGLNSVTMSYSPEHHLLATEDYYFLATDSQGVYRSDDGINFSLISPQGYYSLKQINGVIFLLGSAPQVSTDGGVTFSAIAGISLSGVVYSDGLYVGYSVHWLGWSTDGVTWNSGTGYDSSYSYRCVNVADTGVFVAGTASHGTYYSTDGATWAQNSSENTLTVSVLFNVKGVLINDNMRRSADGINWIKPSKIYTLDFLAYNDDIILGCARGTSQFVYSEIK